MCIHWSGAGGEVEDIFWRQSDQIGLKLRQGRGGRGLSMLPTSVEQQAWMEVPWAGWHLRDEQRKRITKGSQEEWASRGKEGRWGTPGGSHTGREGTMQGECHVKPKVPPPWRWGLRTLCFYSSCPTQGIWAVDGSGSWALPHCGKTPV